MKVFVLMSLWNDFNSTSETYTDAFLFATQQEAEAERDRLANEYVSEYLHPETPEEQESDYQRGFVTLDNGHTYWSHESVMNEYEYRLDIVEREL